MHVHTRTQRFDLTLVRCEMRVGEVTDVDGFGAVVRKLMSAGTANSNGRVCSYIGFSISSPEEL